MYYYGALWYDPALERFVQADSIVPVASQGVQAWDRYAYVNNNPLRYNDPSGQCIDPDSCPSSTEVVFSYESMGSSQELWELTGSENTNSDIDELRNFATQADHAALAIDAMAEVVVVEHVLIGATAGIPFEGEIGGADAGWILGEINPITQELISIGNMFAGVASGASILADVLSGNSRLQAQVLSNQGQLSLDVSVQVSSNTSISFGTAVAGLSTRVVEGSILLQGAAVANDHGWIPTTSYFMDFHLP